VKSKILIIAEIAQAHDGSLGIAHSYIDALSKTGIDVVKFQTHIAQAESSAFEPFRTKFSYEDSTRFDYWKRMEFTEEQWVGLKEHSEQVGLEFLSSPFSNKAIDLLERIGVRRYKIGSGEVTNFLLLEKVARTKKPVILSSGMSSIGETAEAIAFLKSHSIDVSLLQCTTAYPTQPEEWGLNVIHEFKTRFSCRVGFSDHSGDIYACLAAAALGAQILEFHVVFDHNMFGPDAKASLTMSQVKKLVEGVRQLERSFARDSKMKEGSKFDTLKVMFGKSLAINKDLPKGHILSFDDLEGKKPGDRGIAAKDYGSVVGKKLTVNKSAFDFLSAEDIS